MTTKMASYGEMITKMRQVFLTGRTKEMQWREAQLGAMLKMLEENRDVLSDALYQDLHKSKFESCVFEVDYCRNDLINCMNNLSEWAKPEKVKKNLINLLDKAYIRREPYGVALIIGAWNYPVQLTILPMIGAIAAGNCLVLKPSELSWTTAKVLEDLIPKYLDNDCIKCINGGVPETTELLKQKWDNIFYTGNSTVGKIVMRAAAEYLTPVTLELGGKSPVYVDRNCDLATVSNRIMWGKMTNSGQTCIAPDYIMCPRDIQDALVEKMKATLVMFYPDGVDKSADYPRIVNDRHFQRIEKVIEQNKEKIAFGGESEAKERFIAPTVLTNVTFSDPVMQEEIFGPVLPIVPVQDENEAIEHIQSGPFPLSLYIFSRDNSLVEKIIESVQSGNVCVNDTLMQGSRKGSYKVYQSNQLREKPLALYIFSNNGALVERMANDCSSGGLCINDCLMQGGLPTLPFGGVGNSGMGNYHGKFSFDAFSHRRAVMHRGLNMETVQKIRYPPFTEKKRNAVSRLQNKKLNKGGLAPLLPYFIVGTLVAILVKMYISGNFGF